MSRDVRSIANFVLDLAEVQGVGVSNLSINKIVYFLHANFLAKFDEPLVSAKIEAWDYGPVFRELYREFKVVWHRGDYELLSLKQLNECVEIFLLAREIVRNRIYEEMERTIGEGRSGRGSDGGVPPPPLA